MTYVIVKVELIVAPWAKTLFIPSFVVTFADGFLRCNCNPDESTVYVFSGLTATNGVLSCGFEETVPLLNLV